MWMRWWIWLSRRPRLVALVKLCIHNVITITALLSISFNIVLKKTWNQQSGSEKYKKSFYWGNKWEEQVMFSQFVESPPAGRLQKVNRSTTRLWYLQPSVHTYVWKYTPSLLQQNLLWFPRWTQKGGSTETDVCGLLKQDKQNIST